ncbi:MAG: hypothetical protein CR972_00525 [Candidatus Moraniibacteriota bacterium]|nr:MAG: hypothetical protein CR972_00525 [Candidatus Moranbacteria bacterium]
MDYKESGFACEKAIAFLHRYMITDGQNKPVLFHSVRVGTDLFCRGYEKDIVIAGFLHDVLEDGAHVTAEMLTAEFGLQVACIVQANTKDQKITDKNTQREDMIKRCIATGEAATIVKAGDVLDNMMYYTMTRDHQQLSRHCLLTARLLLQKLPDTYTDVIFTRLKKKC